MNKDCLQAETEDMSQLFISSTWRQAISRICHLCQYSQKSLVITGEANSGKTKFCESFLSSDLLALKTAKLEVKYNRSIECMMQTIAQEFRLPWEDKDHLIQEHTLGMNNSITSLSEHGQVWVLLIDDAHLLSPEQLLALLKLVRYDLPPHRQLHLIFVGEPSIQSYFDQHETIQAFSSHTYFMSLPAWDINDMADYLSTIQFSFNDKLSGLTVEDLHKISRGIPGNVVSLIKKGHGYTMSYSSKKKTNFFSKSITIGIALGLVTSVGFLIFNFEEEEFELEPTLRMAEFDPSSMIEKAENSKKTSHKKIAQDQEPEGFFLVESEEINDEQGLPESLASKLTQVGFEDVPVPKARQTQEAQILALNHKHFTLQLLTAKEEAEVVKFIAQNNISEDVNYYRTTHSGEDWFGVLYGNFTTYAEAIDAIKNIPSNLKVTPPLVRELESVQSEIKNNLQTAKKAS